ncbi:membrane bound O-acyl transferase family-domain-containing protein [Xylaria acuta]|nr:membrane bound O-acyl transferase family-domain-containing protein [Xylaria acuta]
MPPYATFSVASSPDLYVSNKIYTPPTGSAYPHILLALSVPLAFTSPPFPGRNLFFSSLIVALAISTQIDPHFTNDPGIAQPFSQLWSVWFAALERLFASSRPSHVAGKPVIGPESLFWRNGRAAREAEGLAGFSPAKILWALALTINLRGAGWNYLVDNVPTLTPAERTSRFRFLVSRIFKALYCFLMADIANQLWMQLFFVANTGSGYTEIGMVDSKYLTIRDPNLGWRLIKTVAWGPLPYYSISFQYNMLSLFMVATTLSEPEDWPPLFGSISEVTSVRAFWGKFWHQLIRRSFKAFTGYVVDAFRIPRGTLWSSNVQIWLTFITTSFFHAQLNLITPVPSNIDFAERTRGMFQFFLWQALAISFEDTVQRIWGAVERKWGPLGSTGRTWHALRKPLGWMWVVLSFWISIPWAADLTLRFRFGDELMVPFSIVSPWVTQLFQNLREH